MTSPYRTASPPVVARPSWARRALCAIGSHSLYLVLADGANPLAEFSHAQCEHCGHREEMAALDMGEYVDAVVNERTDRRWVDALDKAAKRRAQRAERNT